VESPFDILLVDPEASEEEIDRAYRRRVLETHPDQGGTAREFQRVREAYEQVKSGELVAPEPDPTWDAEDVEVDVDAGAEARAAGNGDTAGANGETKTGTTEDGADGGADEATEREGRRVAFLNYDVLADHGWSLDDDDLFEKAAEADLDPSDYGRVLVRPRESLLEAAEECGFTWPYSCRGGACANCAVAVTEGEMEMPAGQILTDEYVDQGIRLSCISAPTTEDAKVVFNVKHLPGLDELRLPPRQFDGAQLND
jgi:curved DNA-binding protein CbpA